MRLLNILVKQINLLNFLLLAGIAAVVILLVVPLFIGKLKAPQADPATAEQTKIEPAAQPAIPPLQEYAVVSEKNLFHSQRIVPPKKTDEVIQRPEFVLYGTLMMDNLQIAYLTDGKAPRSTPGRGKRQTGLKRGESMSGYTLKEVLPDRVIMVRGDDTIEVKVIAPGGKKNRGVDGGVPAAPSKPATTPKPATPAPSPRPAVSPRGAIPPTPANPAGTSRRPRDNRINPNVERPAR